MQLPAGMLADKVPRRTVLHFQRHGQRYGPSMMLVTNSVVGGIALVYVMSFLFGFDISDLLDLRRARLDFVDQDRMMTLSASIFLRHRRHRLSLMAAGLSAYSVLA